MRAVAGDLALLGIPFSRRRKDNPIKGIRRCKHEQAPGKKLLEQEISPKVYKMQGPMMVTTRWSQFIVAANCLRRKGTVRINLRYHPFSQDDLLRSTVGGGLRNQKVSFHVCWLTQFSGYAFVSFVYKRKASEYAKG